MSEQVLTVERVSTENEGDHQTGSTVSESNGDNVADHEHETVLGEDDFRDVRRELVSIKASYYQLGVELPWVFRQENWMLSEKNILTMLTKLLMRFGPPTWKRLIEAVNSPAGGNNSALSKEMTLRHAGPSNDSCYGVQQTQVVHFQSTPKGTVIQRDSSPDQFVWINLERIQAKFSSLLLEVQIRLEAKNVKVSHVCQFLSQFLINRYEGEPDILNYEKFSAVFMDVAKRRLWTYQHHSPLEMLTEKFLCDDQVVKDLIKQYKNDLSGFLVATKLIEYIKETSFPDEELEEVEDEDAALPQLTKKQYRYLKVVLNLSSRKISELSLNYVQELWEQLAEEFDLPLLTTVIKKIVTGSLVITWLVSSDVAEIIMHNSRKSIRFFRQHKIVSLAIDDTTVYNENQMMECEKQFFEVCSNVPADVGKVSALLELGVDPNVESGDGETGLILACCKGQKSVAELLINRGANVHYQDKIGFTPLHHASVNGKSEIVQLLIEKGAQVDVPVKPHTCVTALILACQMGHMGVVELLIHKAANVNYQDKDGCTALHYASHNGNFELVQMLTEKGAHIDISAKGDARRTCVTALILACFGGYKDVAELLIQKGANINHQDKDGFSALHCASQNGHFDVVNMLAEKGAHIDIPTTEENNSITSLSLACFAGHKAVAELLIQKGANVNYQDKIGFTVLHYASQNGHLEVVKMLTEEMAQVDISTKEEKNCSTPLSLACFAGHKAVAELLIQKGANVNYRDKDGFTALHYSSRHGHLEVVELLIEKAAQVDILSKAQEINCDSALSLACCYGHKAVAELLIEKGANINYQDKDGFTALHYASRNGHLEIVKMLTEKGALVNFPAKDNNYSETALILACMFGHKAVAELLIQKGANVNYQDKIGFTVLHYASQNGHLEVVKNLTEKGALVNLPVQDKYSETALILACMFGHKAVAELLIQKGASVNYQDKNGFSPIHFASGDIVQLLIDNNATIPATDQTQQSFGPHLRTLRCGARDDITPLKTFRQVLKQRPQAYYVPKPIETGDIDRSNVTSFNS